MNPIIKKTLLLSAAALILLTASTIIAADFVYQADWPKSPMNTSMDADPTLAEGVKYVYEWGIGLGGIAVFIVLVMAGFQYITSVGDPTKMKEAFKRIEEAVVGLLILLSSYAILNLVGLNLGALKMNMFEPEFDNPVSTCSQSETDPAGAADCCKNSNGSAIAGCFPKFYKCVEGTCQPNLNKTDCSKVEIIYAEGGSKTIGNSQLDNQIELPSDVTVASMKLYSMEKDDSNNYLRCYDPADDEAKDTKNPVCNCGIQLFTKKSTTSTGGELTNTCENNTDIQFAADNTTLKSYVQGKRVVCVTLSKQPSVY